MYTTHIYTINWIVNFITGDMFTYAITIASA